MHVVCLVFNASIFFFFFFFFFTFFHFVNLTFWAFNARGILCAQPSFIPLFLKLYIEDLTRVLMFYLNH